MAIQKEVGHGFDGSSRLTLSVIAGLLLVIAGVGLIVFVGSFIFGVPLLLLGLLLPIFLELILGRKQD